MTRPAWCGMRFAVAAALTGTFSLVDAFGTFLWISTGGIAIGVGVTWTGNRCEELGLATIRRGDGFADIDQPADPLRCLPRGRTSALLGYSRGRCRRHHHELRGTGRPCASCHQGPAQRGLGSGPVHRQWHHLCAARRAAATALTGAARVVHESGHHEPVWLLAYVVAITLALAALRFLWVWTSLAVHAVSGRAQGREALHPKLASRRGHIARRRTGSHHAGRRADPAPW